MTARGGRQQRSVQRVELLETGAADEASWGSEPPAAASRPEPASSHRRTWIVVAAVGALVSLVVAADLLADDGERSATPPPSSAIVTTTTAAPASAPATATSTDDRGDPSTGTGVGPYVLAQPAPGYVLASADRYSGGSDPTFGQLWATWAADPATATWVSITVWPGGDDWWTTGTSRVWLNTGVGIVNRAPDGTMVLDANRDGYHVNIQANGLEVPALAAVMDSLVVDGGRLDGSTALDALGLRLVAGSDPDAVTDTGDRTSSVLSYASTGGATSWISVQVEAPLNTFTRAMRNFRLRDPVAMTIGAGHLATVATDGRFGDPSMSIVIVDVDGVEVEISGNASRRELVYVASTLRVGTEDEWRDLVGTARTFEAPSERVDMLAIGDGRLRTGAGWNAGLSVRDGGPPLLEVGFRPNERGGSAPPLVSMSSALDEGDVGIQAVAGEAGVVLVARTGREHAGAELRVTVADASYHASVVDPGPAAPGLFAALGFSELAAYHAELVDADGTVVAALDGT